TGGTQNSVRTEAAAPPTEPPADTAVKSPRTAPETSTVATPASQPVRLDVSGKWENPEVSSDDETLPQVPFETATLDAFWSEVLAHSPDRLMTHLRKTDNVAISGPNDLELSFPHSYVLSRQFCERPETLGRIAELASRVAGRMINVKVVASRKAGETPTR